jgi:hypothetical protein
LKVLKQTLFGCDSALDQPEKAILQSRQLREHAKLEQADDEDQYQRANRDQRSAAALIVIVIAGQERSVRTRGVCDALHLRGAEQLRIDITMSRKRTAQDYREDQRCNRDHPKRRL